MLCEKWKSGEVVFSFFLKSIKCFVIFSALSWRRSYKHPFKTWVNPLIVSVYTVNFEILKEKKLKRKRKSWANLKFTSKSAWRHVAMRSAPRGLVGSCQEGSSVFPARAKREELVVPRSLPPAATGEVARALSLASFWCCKKKKKKYSDLFPNQCFLLILFGLY